MSERVRIDCGQRTAATLGIGTGAYYFLVDIAC